MTVHPLTGRKAIITGAGKGIGRAMAHHFAKAGAELVLVARSAGDLEKVAAEISAAGGKAHYIPADMGSVDQIAAMVEQAAGAMGGIDIVVSNAAAYGDGPIAELSLEQWNEAQRVNVVGTLALLQAAYPHLSANPASNVLIISSIRGLSGTPGTGAYGASKAALNHLTRTLAVEWGPAGVRVNALLPGPVLTPQMEIAVQNPKIGEKYRHCAPLADWTHPDDIAEPALFLVSGAARRITGQLLVVDGGLVAINQDCLVLA
ncbi:SDR family NAD(P)-dependent oxidoreductase [Sphingobium xenophagum]|uniref:SDR family NAD(P)-dependent oxidoreductase n=1 Tax=Sphingobium xenophagum TaxID=121428 RepID=UPI00241FE83C|nr:SDR family oxidoreductase [Sphingobium xenophagum]